MATDGVVFEGDSAHGHYQVVDLIYAGRPARVLYSGDRLAAQSGIAKDEKDDLLFDYNQRFRELVSGLTPKRVLLIGGGAFTLPKKLLEEQKGIAIDIVELDNVLLDIARMYFGFKPNRRTRVFVDDGRRFMEYTKYKYDLIMIDAFNHTSIPESLQTIEAVRSYKKHLFSDGILAINLISTYKGDGSTVLKRLIAKFQMVFDRIELYQASTNQSLWSSQNFILTAQNSTQEIEKFMRSEKLELPVVD